MNSLSCCTFNSKCQDFLLWRCECCVQHLLTVFNEFCLTWPNFHHLCYCVTGVLSLHMYGVKKHFSWSWGKIRTSLILACCLDFPVYLGLINLSGIHWALGWPFVLKKCSINLVWAARDCVLITVPECLVTIFYSQLPFIQFLFTSQGLCRIHFFSYLLSPTHALGIKPLLTSTKPFKIKRWKVLCRSL